jgi:hypothetical protein
MRLSGPRSRPITSQKNLVAPGIEEECIYDIGGKNILESDHFEYRKIEGRIILKWIFGKYI